MERQLFRSNVQGLEKQCRRSSKGWNSGIENFIASQCAFCELFMNVVKIVGQPVERFSGCGVKACNGPGFFRMLRGVERTE